MIGTAGVAASVAVAKGSGPHRRRAAEHFKIGADLVAQGCTRFQVHLLPDSPLTGIAATAQVHAPGTEIDVAGADASDARGQCCFPFDDASLEGIPGKGARAE
ncbi:hypothetical protein D3C79_930120 [compost metagenome]